jgi:cell division septation protein DedD
MTAATAPAAPTPREALPEGLGSTMPVANAHPPHHNAHAAARPVSGRSGLGIAQDPATGRIRFDATPVSLIVAGTSLLLIVVLGFALGRWTAPAGVAEAEPDPSVLDVARPAVPAPTGRVAQSTANVVSTITPQASDPAPPPAVEPGQRINGMNYVLVQSYAKSERDRAEATVAAIRAAGLGATIEENIPGWSSRLCVFGTKPFERVTSNPEFDRYEAQLMAVSERHRRNNLIKRFDPHPVQWGR